jgi:hypothetical protein
MVRTSLQLQPHGIAPESIKDTFAVTEQPQQSLKPPSCLHTKKHRQNTLGERFEDTECQAGPAKQQDLEKHSIDMRRSRVWNTLVVQPRATRPCIWSGEHSKASVGCQSTAESKT